MSIKPVNLELKAFPYPTINRDEIYQLVGLPAQCPRCGRSKEDHGFCSNSFHKGPNKRNCSTGCDWPDCTLEGCVNNEVNEKPTIEVTYCETKCGRDACVMKCNYFKILIKPSSLV
jgi:hypothetical protein